MKKQLKKNIHQRLLYKETEKKRLIIKALSQNLLIKNQIRWKIQTNLVKFPLISSLTQIRNRCILTGRPRSIFRQFKISHIQFKKWASKGFLPGVVKNSW